MVKRLIASAFVSVLTVVGVASTADAAPKGGNGHVVSHAIDWD
ncbi:hypothetical protein [Aeromicrobium sp. NPDC092404]